MMLNVFAGMYKGLAYFEDTRLEKLCNVCFIPGIFNCLILHLNENGNYNQLL